MDFRDVRGMKVVLVPHCALNQNARLAETAERPAAVSELITGLLERGIGIVQMPCPELLLLGLDRERLAIRSELARPQRLVELRRLAEGLADQIEQYRACGVRVLGILAKDGSPSCGLERTHFDDHFGAGQGVFIEQLQAVLAARGLDVPLAGTVDSDPAAALAVVDRWGAGE